MDFDNPLKLSSTLTENQVKELNEYAFPKTVLKSARAILKRVENPYIPIVANDKEVIEKLLIERFGGTHNEDRQGHDGYLICGQALEAKNKQYSTSSIHSLIFDRISETNFLKFVEGKPFMIHSISNHGVMIAVYVIEMDEDFLKRYNEKMTSNAGGSYAYSFKHYKDNITEVLYMNPLYKLFTKLNDNFYKIDVVERYIKENFPEREITVKEEYQGEGVSKYIDNYVNPYANNETLYPSKEVI